MKPNRENKMLHSVDFASGPVWRCILIQSVPLMIAQLVQLLYNIVDRIYIGHMGGDSLALTGIGLTFPVVTLIMAFAALFGNGGVPIFSIERGAGRDESAGRVLGNSFLLLVIGGAVLTAAGYLFFRPILFAFGASEDSFAYAADYLRIYLAGTVCSMLATGLNGYINAQGFPGIGMISVVLGAVVNIGLDPIFIFAMGMGVSGAALATVIAQTISAAWVVGFLISKKAIIPLKKQNIGLDGGIVAEITKMGLSNFIFQATTCGVQIVCNTTLQLFGGDLYVGIMTALNSIREIFLVLVNGMTNGSQPVIGYNYGAKLYRRARDGIRFNTAVGVAYTVAVWLLVLLFPTFWLTIFSDDAALITEGAQMLRIYFFGFAFMALHFAGQAAFVSLKDARHAIFFSLLRKAIVVIPLTLILPRIGFGVKGVFLAEPISNVISGIACYLTMRLTQWRRLERLEKESAAQSDKLTGGGEESPSPS
jgi:putative MATE family efflux protein